MAIRPLTVEHLDDYRTIRLRSLTTDPDAFGSTLARESEFNAAAWRSRLQGFAGRPGQVFIDEIDGNPVGVVGIGRSELPDDAMLWGMWVDPTVRGRGVGARLVDAAIEWALANECSTVTLWVMRSNDSALRLYERHGFDFQADTGRDAPDGCADELRMQTRLA